jgi:hypothetical protein
VAPGKGIPELLGGPLGRRVGGDIDVDDASAIMGQDQEDIQDLETDSRDGEEIHRDQVVDVVLQERAPRLRRGLSASRHVLADASLPDVDAQLEQFTMDPRGAPERILPAHARIRSLISREIVGLPARPRRPFHVQNKRKPLRCHRITVSGLTITSAARQSTQTRDSAAQKRRSATRQPWSPSRRALQDANLVTECQDFYLERRAGLPRGRQGGQERRDDTEHWIVRLSQTWRKSNDFNRSRFWIGTGSKESVSPTELWALNLSGQRGQLLTEREILERDGSVSATEQSDRSEE